MAAVVLNFHPGLPSSCGDDPVQSVVWEKLTIYSTRIRAVSPERRAGSHIIFTGPTALTSPRDLFIGEPLG